MGREMNGGHNSSLFPNNQAKESIWLDANSVNANMGKYKTRNNQNQKKKVISAVPDP
jgi:hypothetical protein